MNQRETNKKNLMRLDLEYLTKIEQFEENETTDDCRYYRCLAHDLEVKPKHTLSLIHI